jgi:hypothetical protein
LAGRDFTRNTFKKQVPEEVSYFVFSKTVTEQLGNLASVDLSDAFLDVVIGRQFMPAAAETEAAICYALHINWLGNKYHR